MDGRCPRWLEEPAIGEKEDHRSNRCNEEDRSLGLFLRVRLHDAVVKFTFNVDAVDKLLTHQLRKVAQYVTVPGPWCSRKRLDQCLDGTKSRSPY